MAVSHSVVLYEPTETSAEVVTVAGFLAGYSGRTREAYTLDLRQFIRWCDEHRLAPPHPCDVRRLRLIRSHATNPGVPPRV